MKSFMCRRWGAFTESRWNA